MDYGIHIFYLLVLLLRAFSDFAHASDREDCLHEPAWPAQHLKPRRCYTLDLYMFTVPPIATPYAEISMTLHPSMFRNFEMLLRLSRTGSSSSDGLISAVVVRG